MLQMCRCIRLAPEYDNHYPSINCGPPQFGQPIAPAVNWGISCQKKCIRILNVYMYDIVLRVGYTTLSIFMTLEAMKTF